MTGQTGALAYADRWFMASQAAKPSKLIQPFFFKGEKKEI